MFKVSIKGELNVFNIHLFTIQLMKYFFILLIFALIFPLPGVKAQQTVRKDSVEAVFSNSKVNVEWNLLATLNYHKVNSNVKPGLALEVVINRHFVTGLFAQFTSGNFAVKHNGYQNNVISKDFGFFIGTTQKTSKLVHLGAQLKVGLIQLQADSTGEISPFHKNTFTAEDSGITIYPEVNASLNLLKRFKLRMATGYNVLLINKETVVNERDLDSWFFSTSLIFTLR